MIQVTEIVPNFAEYAKKQVAEFGIGALAYIQVMRKKILSRNKKIIQQAIEHACIYAEGVSICYDLLCICRVVYGNNYFLGRFMSCATGENLTSTTGMDVPAINIHLFHKNIQDVSISFGMRPAMASTLHLWEQALKIELGINDANFTVEGKDYPSWLPFV